MNIGTNIAKARLARNMTQEQLAEEMHVSFQAVSGWETGTSVPDTRKIPELARCSG